MPESKTPATGLNREAAALNKKNYELFLIFVMDFFTSE